MSTSAKGVLLFPTDRKPDGVTWDDVGRIWTSPSGVLPIEPSMRSEEPHQVVGGAEHSGAYRLLDIQMQLFQQIAGVNNALQGRLDSGSSSAALFESQVRNSATAILDLLESFDGFRRMRDALVSDC